MQSELAVLQECLRAQRRHVLGIVAGLGADALRRPVLPSGWSPAGLVNHLALDVERFWFRAVVAGEAGLTGYDDAWQLAPDADPLAIVARYEAEIARADAVIEAGAVDDPPRWWPADQFGTWRLADLRAVMLHVIVETACHAGHLDAVRELLDGRQWLVLAG